MCIRDIVEAVFKAVLKEADVAFKDTNRVSLAVGDIDNTYISGSYDLIVDEAVDDIKSASDYSYKHKFDSYESLEESDPFGYISQLAGYARAAGKKLGGWWVINKASGQFKYVKAKKDVTIQINKIRDTVETLIKNDFSR